MTDGQSRSDVSTANTAIDSANEGDEQVAEPDVGLDKRSDLGLRDHARHAMVIAHQEYLLSFRNRWIVGLTGLFALFATMLVLFSGSRIGPTRFGPLVASLGSLATYLVPLAAFAFGYDVVVGAEEKGWLDVLFSLPIPRAGVVIGKLVGRIGVFATAIAVGFGVAGAVLAVWFGSVAVWSVYATFVLASLGLGTAFLGVSTLISTVSPQKTYALGVGLLAWVWFVLVHDLVALGLVTGFGLETGVLTAVLLLNPVDIFRVLVLKSAGATTGGFAAVFAETNLSSPVLSASLLMWCIAPAIAAAYLINRRSV